MFRPNTTCQLHSRLAQRDVFGKPSYADPVSQACGVVRRDLVAAKTSVRTDSSGTRSNADEKRIDARILFPANASVNLGDLIEFTDYEMKMELVSVFPRRHVLGHIDHIQCDAMITTDI